MRAKLLTVFAFVLLAACGSDNDGLTYIYLPNATKEMPAHKIDNAMFQCRVEATRTIPANNVYSSSGIYSSPTRCSNIGGNISCSGGGISGGAISSVDQNEELRNKVFNQCMLRRGFYRAIYENKCDAKELYGTWKERFNGDIDAETIAAFEYYKLFNSLNEPLKASVSDAICMTEQAKPEDDFAGRLLYPQKVITFWTDPANQKFKDAWIRKAMKVNQPKLEPFEIWVFYVQAHINFCTGKTTYEDLMLDAYSFNRVLNANTDKGSYYSANKRELIPLICNDGYYIDNPLVTLNKKHPPFYN